MASSKWLSVSVILRNDLRFGMRKFYIEFPNAQPDAMIDVGTKPKQNESLKKDRFVMRNQYCNPELAFTYWQDA